MEIPLKWKYRCPKPKGMHKSGYSGNSTKRGVHGTPPKGMRKIYRGKTSFK